MAKIKVELILDRDVPEQTADIINYFFKPERARYSVYKNGKVVNNLKDFCINCEPNPEEK